MVESYLSSSNLLKKPLSAQKEHFVRSRPKDKLQEVQFLILVELGVVVVATCKYVFNRQGMVMQPSSYR